jgi:hypothetical protein
MKTLSRILGTALLASSLTFGCARKNNTVPIDVYEHLPEQRYETIVGRVLGADTLSSLNNGIGLAVEHNGHDTVFAYFTRHNGEFAEQTKYVLSSIKNSKEIELIGMYAGPDKKRFEIYGIKVGDKRVQVRD